jgi:AcrR family transcriptional regulator
VGGTQVSDVQCARMLAAAVEVVGEVGYGGMTVARITARAGVSRRTFYDLFEDREDCFLKVFDDAVARASVAVGQAASGERSWRGRTRAGLAALLMLFDEEPLLGSLVVVDALAAGPAILERRAMLLAHLSKLIAAGSLERGGAHKPPPLTAEGVVGAVLALVHARMLEDRSRPLIELLNPLMGIIALPYLGQRAVERELTGVVPDLRRPAPRVRLDPLEGLDMRLTYRTLRALAAIATHPGASNRMVAETAGVQDQGQMSKLLARLETLGLIVNGGLGQAKGESNAWSLTPKGEEVERSVQVPVHDLY